VVVAVGGTADGQVRRVEKLQGGPFQRAFGENKGEHGRQPFIDG